MAKVTSFFAPIKATITPNGGAVSPGSTAVIDTNVPATILYSLDGSQPTDGEFGTFKAEAPVTIELRVSTTIRFKAIDNGLGRSFNQTKTQKAVFTVNRVNPIEVFRRVKRFYVKLNSSIVDENFYLSEGWVVPVSQTRFTYLFKNIEGSPMRLRPLHNGVEIFPGVFPVLPADGKIELPIFPVSGDNTIEVETEPTTIGVGDLCLYDIGLYDINVYGP